MLYNRGSRIHNVQADVAIADTDADKTVNRAKLLSQGTFGFGDGETSSRHYPFTIVTLNSLRTSSIGFASVMLPSPAKRPLNKEVGGDRPQETGPANYSIPAIGLLEPLISGTVELLP